MVFPGILHITSLKYGVLEIVSAPGLLWLIMSHSLFEQKIQPDVGEMTDLLFRRRPPRRVHHIELFLDAEIKQAAAARFGIGADLDRSDPLLARRFRRPAAACAPAASEQS